MLCVPTSETLSDTFTKSQSQADADRCYRCMTFQSRKHMNSKHSESITNLNELQTISDVSGSAENMRPITNLKRDGRHEFECQCRYSIVLRTRCCETARHVCAPCCGGVHAVELFVFLPPYAFVGGMPCTWVDRYRHLPNLSCGSHRGEARVAFSAVSLRD